MPLANGFLTPDQFAGEYFFNLSAAYCPRCTLVQLVEQPQRERMFNDRYPFFSATSARMQEHFARAGRATSSRRCRRDDPFVVEIGSNDGTLLRHVAARGHSPSRDRAVRQRRGAASAGGVDTIGEFFDAGVAQARSSRSTATPHAIIAANALSHIADLHSVVEGIAILLAPGGTCVIEDPYWGDVVAQTAFDQIYDEHASYFTLSSLSRLFEQHGLAVLDAMPIRCAWRLDALSDRPARIAAGRRARQRAARSRACLGTARACRPSTDFASACRGTGAALMALLRRCKAEGKRVVGYGATSKSTTTINYFGITPDLVEFISDTTPAKQGTFSPGAHIPVRPHAEFAARYPDRALLFLWNHAAEVRAKEAAFARSGGRLDRLRAGVRGVVTAAGQERRAPA